MSMHINIMHTCNTQNMPHNTCTSRCLYNTCSIMHIRTHAHMQHAACANDATPDTRWTCIAHALICMHIDAHRTACICHAMLRISCMIPTDPCTAHAYVPHTHITHTYTYTSCMHTYRYSIHTAHTCISRASYLLLWLPLYVSVVHVTHVPCACACHKYMRGCVHALLYNLCVHVACMCRTAILRLLAPDMMDV